VAAVQRVALAPSRPQAGRQHAVHRRPHLEQKLVELVREGQQDDRVQKVDGRHECLGALREQVVQALDGPAHRLRGQPKLLCCTEPPRFAARPRQRAQLALRSLSPPRRRTGHGGDLLGVRAILEHVQRRRRQQIPHCVDAVGSIARRRGHDRLSRVVDGGAGPSARRTTPALPSRLALASTAKSALWSSLSKMSMVASLRWARPDGPTLRTGADVRAGRCRANRALRHARVPREMRMRRRTTAVLYDGHALPSCRRAQQPSSWAASLLSALGAARWRRAAGSGHASGSWMTSFPSLRDVIEEPAGDEARPPSHAGVQRKQRTQDAGGRRRTQEDAGGRTRAQEKAFAPAAVDGQNGRRAAAGRGLGVD